MRYVIAAVFFITSVWFSNPTVNATEASLQEYGNKVIATALSRLKVQPDDDNLACLTNAGYVTYNGQDTFLFIDLLTQKTHISLGRGNLLQVHTVSDEPLFFAFVQKKSSKELLLTYLKVTDQKIHATEPLNVYVDINQSFEKFTTVLGEKSFAVVTIANGWADGVPWDLMQGALWHDHLCCGVFSGYFTINFIRQNFPLKEKEQYYYIGAPAWCQDDYITRALNLTPGKHGYYTMAYPWSRPWTTAEKTYAQLGGIIIQFNSATQSGKAHLLQFNWCEEDFKEYLGMPKLELNWGKDRWLHVCYNRFFIKHLNKPEKFVSILKTKALKKTQDLNRLIDLGANPLEEILGVDENWIPERE
jgi:formylmethanofuran dehydrogenase subunit E-like metal-binding protein